jgi:hypothetical protein
MAFKNYVFSSVFNYYIFEYYSSKRKKQSDRGNKKSVFHTFILLFLKVSLVSHVTPGRVGFSGLAIKTILGFLPSPSVPCAMFTSFDHQTNIW